MVLDYTLSPGWMKPFVEGLFEGKTVGLKCTSCSHTSFPPQRTCTCGAMPNDWITLSGAAEIVFRTSGADGDFGLVQFDGADTQSVVRLEDIKPQTQRGQIAKSEVGLPMMILKPIPNEVSL